MQSEQSLYYCYTKTFNPSIFLVVMESFRNPLGRSLSAPALARWAGTPYAYGVAVFQDAVFRDRDPGSSLTRRLLGATTVFLTATSSTYGEGMTQVVLPTRPTGNMSRTCPRSLRVLDSWSNNNRGTSFPRTQRAAATAVSRSPIRLHDIYACPRRHQWR